MALRINELDIYAGARYEDIRGLGTGTYILKDIWGGGGQIQGYTMKVRFLKVQEYMEDICRDI
jgi:hypothetical protein